MADQDPGLIRDARSRFARSAWAQPESLKGKLFLAAIDKLGLAIVASISLGMFQQCQERKAELKRVQAKQIMTIRDEFGKLASTHLEVLREIAQRNRRATPDEAARLRGVRLQISGVVDDVLVIAPAIEPQSANFLKAVEASNNRAIVFRGDFPAQVEEYRKTYFGFMKSLLDLHNEILG